MIMSDTAVLASVTEKEHAVRDWVRRKLGSVAHELRVLALAHKFFELTSRWHALGGAEKRLLGLAALVHDVGRATCDKDHARVGAQMLMENANLPLTDADRRRMAFLTRYHRGKVPERGLEEYLDPGTDDIQELHLLLALLRAADTLDSRSLAPPHLLMTVRARVLTVYGYVAGDAETVGTALGKRKKFMHLEDLLQCKVRTEWFSTDRLALVS
jgi:exopolyphosphatase/pppGpp-phosphohydrolase